MSKNNMIESAINSTTVTCEGKRPAQITATSTLKPTNSQMMNFSCWTNLQPKLLWIYNLYTAAVWPSSVKYGKMSEPGFIANEKDRIQGLFKDLQLQFSSTRSIDKKTYHTHIVTTIT